MEDWLPGLAEPGKWMSSSTASPGTPPTAWSSTARTCSSGPGSASRPAPARSGSPSPRSSTRTVPRASTWPGRTVHALRLHLGGGRRTGRGGGRVLAGHPGLRGRPARHGLLPRAAGPGRRTGRRRRGTPPQAGVFAKGSVAQIVAVPGLAQTILKENPGLQGKLGFFPVPGKTAGRPGAVFTGGSDLVVPKNTDEHDGALAVVEALAGTEWNTELARTMNYVPNKESLADAVAAGGGWPRWRPAPPGTGDPRYAPVGRGRGGQPDQGVHDEGAHRERRGGGGPQDLRPHHRTPGPGRPLTRAAGPPARAAVDRAAGLGAPRSAPRSTTARTGPPRPSTSGPAPVRPPSARRARPPGGTSRTPRCAAPPRPRSPPPGRAPGS